MTTINRCIVYSSVENYIITLSLDLNTPHNLDRVGVINDKNALFLCEQASVVFIENKDDPQNILSYLYGDICKDELSYKVGENIKYNNYKYGKYGIYIFKTKKAAYYYNKYKYIPYGFTGNLKEYYPESGNIVSEHTYKNGKKHGICKGWWRESGSPMYKTKYKNGILNGNSITSNQNGKIESIIPYKNEKIHGTYKYWHIPEYFMKNGSFYWEIQYKNGKIHGNVKKWYKNGLICEIIRYINGEGIKEKKTSLKIMNKHFF